MKYIVTHTIYVCEEIEADSPEQAIETFEEMLLKMNPLDYAELVSSCEVDADAIELQ